MRLLQSDQRITTPLVRQNGQLKSTDWESAIELAVEKLSAAANQGDNSLAMLISPQATLRRTFSGTTTFSWPWFE